MIRRRPHRLNRSVGDDCGFVRRHRETCSCSLTSAGCNSAPAEQENNCAKKSKNSDSKANQFGLG